MSWRHQLTVVRLCRAWSVSSGQLLMSRCRSDEQLDDTLTTPRSRNYNNTQLLHSTATTTQHTTTTQPSYYYTTYNYYTVSYRYRYRYLLTLLRLESRITSYKQKCLKATNMAHNKSSATDTDTYTDIYWQFATTRCVIITGTPNSQRQNVVNMRFISTKSSGPKHEIMLREVLPGLFTICTDFTM